MADVRDEELARLIGLNITKRLIAHDRNQQDLADYLGVSKSTVSMWVNGKRTPLMRTIDQICKYFACTREDIMRDNKKNHGFKPLPLRFGLFPWFFISCR